MNTSKIEALLLAANTKVEFHLNYEMTASDQVAIGSNQGLCLGVPRAASAEQSPVDAVMPPSFKAGDSVASSGQSILGSVAECPGENVPNLIVRKEGTGSNGQRDFISLPAYSTNGRRNLNFAEKLYMVVSEKKSKHSHVITWLPLGKSFCIIDKEAFTKEVLPNYFRETKFESFLRRLKRWGFAKVYTTSAKHIVFSHILFQKDRLDLCKMMNGRAGEVKNKRSKDTAAAEKVTLDSVQPVEGKMTNEMALAERSLLAPGGTMPERECFHSMQNVAGNQESQLMKFQITPNLGPSQEPQPFTMNYQPPVLARSSFQMSSTRPMAMMQYQPQVNFARNGMFTMYDHRVALMSYSRMANANVMDQQFPVLEAGMNNIRESSRTSNNMFPVPGRFAAVPDTEVPAGMDAMNQLSSLEADIADCEEQLEILHRLKTLKQKMRRWSAA